MIGNCHTCLKSSNRYSLVNDLVKHIRVIHKVPISGKSNWCGVCHTDIGRCPANHGCFKFRKMLILTNDNCPFQCDECTQAFPNYKGLNNHRATHKKTMIQNNYNRKNALPPCLPTIVIWAIIVIPYFPSTVVSVPKLIALEMTRLSAPLKIAKWSRKLSWNIRLRVIKLMSSSLRLKNSLQRLVPLLIVRVLRLIKMILL